MVDRIREKTPVVRSFRHHFERKAREGNDRCNKRWSFRCVTTYNKDEVDVFCVTDIVIGHKIFDVEKNETHLLFFQAQFVFTFSLCISILIHRAVDPQIDHFGHRLKSLLLLLLFLLSSSFFSSFSPLLDRISNRYKCAQASNHIHYCY